MARRDVIARALNDIDGGGPGEASRASRLECKRTTVTSLEVARRAGVSQSAVSRVFSGASASRETSAKVRRAAEELGYRPNPIARAMSTGRSGIVGLVIANLDNQFYPVALECFSATLQARGYRILLFLRSAADAGIEEAIREFLDYRVDGIIAASVSLSDRMTRQCEAAGIPMVMFNRAGDAATVSAVTSANALGGRMVADLLLDAGHERIAHIAGWSGSSTGQGRQRGFLERLAERNAGPVAVIDGMYSREAAASAARHLADLSDPPDAIFVGGDHMAFAVLDVLRAERGLRVPDDVAVVGYDDVPLASWPAYRLTTVRQPLERMVEATVETLIARILEPCQPARLIEISCELILRETTRRLQG